MKKYKVTLESYNKNAASYAEKFMEYEDYKSKTLKFARSYIKPGSKVLDLGCGPGNNIKILKELDPSLQLTGVDFSEEMISIASKKNPGSKFIIQDLRELGLKDKFDSVIASFVIVHLSMDDTKRLIKKISLLLKSSGSLFISFMTGKEPGFENTSFSSHDSFYFNYYEKDSIPELLISNNIIPEYIETSPYKEKDGSITDDIFITAVKK